MLWLLFISFAPTLFQTRDAGIQIIYVAVGEYVTPGHKEFRQGNIEVAKKLAGGPQNFIEVGSFSVSFAVLPFYKCKSMFASCLFL